MQSPNPQPGFYGVRILRSCASALFGVFLVSAILRPLPARLLDPLWHVSFTTTLLDMGGYALLGVALLVIAQLLDPQDPRLARRMQGVRGACRLAAIGYLLLIPLLVSALVRDYLRVDQLSHEQQRLIRREDAQLRGAIQQAGSSDELLLILQRYNAPVIGSAQFRAMPLAASRAEVLKQLSGFTERRLQSVEVSPASRQSILLNNLRLLLLAVVFAFGFSSAHTGFPSLPLLVPLLERLMQRS